ncbi:hypothetical protein FQN54_002179 [Arachnomyces sp. PD_36]|nr:hypothetical protein FQN54_002179 [Arachnomyces sp. PD_36]
MDHDLLDSLLDLEDGFYQEGHDLGAKDGAQAGYIEGSVFAMEKGFERFLEVGRLRGRALIWAGRLPANQDQTVKTTTISRESGDGGLLRDTEKDAGNVDFAAEAGALQALPGLPNNSRLEKHITALLSLVDLDTISTENSEEAISDVDDRLKKAKAKVKIIEKIIGEQGDISGNDTSGGDGVEKDEAVFWLKFVIARRLDVFPKEIRPALPQGKSTFFGARQGFPEGLCRDYSGYSGAIKHFTKARQEYRLNTALYLDPDTMDQPNGEMHNSGTILFKEIDNR